MSIFRIPSTLRHHIHDDKDKFFECGKHIDMTFDSCFSHSSICGKEICGNIYKYLCVRVRVECLNDVVVKTFAIGNIRSKGIYI